jgi:hypothetical protein
VSLNDTTLVSLNDTTLVSSNDTTLVSSIDTTVVLLNDTRGWFTALQRPLRRQYRGAVSRRHSCG